MAPVQLLDHNFDSNVHDDTQLYTCTFATDNGEFGYLIFSYEEGPSVKQWSLHSSPNLYDLQANSEAINTALFEADIDLNNATATRVEWIDTNKNRGAQIILFEDGKGDKYICELGNDDFTIEKQ